MNVLTVIGTRPEAVKMAPLLLALAGEPGVRSLLCATGQHRDMFGQALTFFALHPHHDLGLMRPGQRLNALFARAVAAVDRVLAAETPDRVLVQGDTTTALAAALAAFHRGIPVGHVEAGLRTGDPAAPFPEEMNRRTIDGFADLLFAPTPQAAANLAAERVPGRVLVTGNSGIDALRLAQARLHVDPALAVGLPTLPAGRRLVLATCHRRESFGTGVRAIVAALARLAAREDVEIVWPVHPNPALRGAAKVLDGVSGIRIMPPLGFGAFVALLGRADLVLTDSGGVQEEAAALGRPTLVLRETTERPEGIAAGIARLAGLDADAIVAAATALLAAPAAIPPDPNLYGDGRAAARIVDALLGRPVLEFAPAPPGIPVLAVSGAAAIPAP